MSKYPYTGPRNLSGGLPPSSPELDAAITKANPQTASELREVILQTMAKLGTPIRTQDAEYNQRLVTEEDAERRRQIIGSPAEGPAPAVASLPATPAQRSHYRVAYPSGNMRVELYGVSEQDLDEQERRIKALYA